ncbi:MAG: DUF2798 domain-containing protein [Paracoccaceae bacterium]|nr:DUF2798 domain-containing protein [Paracoccaceae bacterium]
MQHTDPKREKLTIIVAQIFISCLMALSMTLIFSVLPVGFGPGWFATWMQHWLTAWPVAFVFSLGIGPLAFKLAFVLMHRAG